MPDLVRLQADPEELRKELPIPYVLELYGLQPAGSDGARVHYLSPFRPDSRPSLDVFLDDKGNWRWGDFADGGVTGSVIDIVQRLESCTTGEAIGRCREMYSDLPETYHFEIEERGYDLNLGHFQGILSSSPEPATIYEVLAELAHKRPGLPADDSNFIYRLVEHFGVRATEPGEIWTPYYTNSGEPAGGKWRTLSTKKAMAGTRPVLYRSVGDADSSDEWLLVEGETDTWAADWHLGHRYRVVGIPGSGTLPQMVMDEENLPLRVTLAFDGDRAGREATQKWTVWLVEHGVEVFLIPLGDGQDLAGLPPAAIRSLPDRERPILPRPAGLITMGNTYVVPARSEKGNPQVVSDWVLDLERRIIHDDGRVAFEGLVRPFGKRVVLPIEALSGHGQLIRWANATFGGSWQGGGSTTQVLLSLLQHESTFLPEGRMTDRVGMHDGDFVWPDGHIGSSDWTYVPPPSTLNLHDRVRIDEVPSTDPMKALAEIYTAHRSDIIHPILAWLAVAPLRPLFKQFPILSITGGSGSGKTTLTEAMLDIFSGSRISLNLTSTTPYAVTSLVAASNAIPVWFDEYRPGAREDAKNQLDQIIRDGYTGQRSAKGGMTDNKAQVTEIPTDCPLVVTGEESFVETSHTDRMVMVRLTKDGRGPVPPTDELTAGLAHAYLSWLMAEDWTSITLPTPPRPEGLNDRQYVNLQVLTFGWNLLQNWTAEHDATLPDPDWSMVVGQATEAALTNPIMEAVVWAVQAEIGREMAWVEQGVVYIRTADFLNEVKRNGSFTLPTHTVQGVTKFLEESHQAERTRKMKNGKQIRVLALPESELAAVDNQEVQ